MKGIHFSSKVVYKRVKDLDLKAGHPHTKLRLKQYKATKSWPGNNSVYNSTCSYIVYQLQAFSLILSFFT